LPADQSLPEVALRAVLSHPAVHSAIVGFATPQEVNDAADFAARGPLPAWPC
jgi:aryl-alcohol dehydrogenase-like predicted oxidoreductase